MFAYHPQAEGRRQVLSAFSALALVDATGAKAELEVLNMETWVVFLEPPKREKRFNVGSM